MQVARKREKKNNTSSSICKIVTMHFEPTSILFMWRLLLAQNATTYNSEDAYVLEIMI